MKKSSLSERRRNARRFVLQAIYEWEISQNPEDEVILHVYEENDFTNADLDYFNRLFKTVVDHVDKLDSKIEPHLDRSLDELNPIELAVMRLAVGELMFFHDVPPKVVLNEAIELTKEYGATDGYRYVNGVLDKLVKGL